MFRNGVKGFTLIEIMLVVIIIGILAAAILPNFAGRGEQAKRSAARADIDANLSTALDLYELDMGKYPTTQEGLRVLIERPVSKEQSEAESALDNADDWNGPYLKKKKIPKDPWGQEYVYIYPGKLNKDSYDLSSYGPDKLASKDDVVNWEVEKTSK
jgi:general secretion pathway protein G